MIFELPLDQIDGAQLETLRTESVREGRQLEYKESLPGNREDDKREFLGDVTSFANAAGGDLIFGIRERRDADRKPTGEIDAIVGLPGVNLDAECLRLEAIVRDGVAPRMPPVTFREVRRAPDPPCLVLRIPRSWAGLHMVTYTNLSRFYSRNSGGKYQLDVHEIRTAFVAAETAYERLRRFRAERVARIIAHETPTQVGPGPKLILHALPIGSFEEVWARFLTMEERDFVFRLHPIGGTAATWRFNLDGFVLHTLRADLSRQSFTQLFRDGGIETVSGGILVKDEARGGFYAWGMERSVISQFGNYQEFCRTVGVTPPLHVGLTLSGVKGWKVLHGSYEFSDLEGAFDRDIVMPPEVVLSDLGTPADVVLRPLFDFIWNGGGWPGSPNYHEGRWVPPR